MTAAPLPTCPFCGADGEALRVLPPNCTPKSPYSLADRAYPVLRCGGCGASVPGEDWDALGASAIAAWNRRAPEAQAWRAGEGPKDGTVVWLAGHHWGDPRLKHWVTRGSWREVDGTTGWHDLDHAPTNLYPPTHWMPDDPPAPPGATPAAPPAREAEPVEAIRYFLDYEDDRDPFRTREQAVARLRAALAEAEGRALP